jgi:protocatechuate 3,4-dioxygenase beta subunit
MKCFKGFLGTLLLAGLVLPFLLQTTASAQSTGSINGTVTDKSGAVIAGATVVVTDKQTGVSRSVTTDRAGAYAVPSLQPGTYSVKASESGMQVVTSMVSC